MELTLDAVEVRVLGALVEKEITTPEYYPLTLNALVNACNQKTNREPVVSYEEDTVEAALERLRYRRLTAVITGAGLRVPKHRQLFGEALNLGRREIALLCVLMLRDRQTSGELRDRTERMHSFTDIPEVEACLARLMEYEPKPLVAKLPRQPGEKEPRYAHLLSGAPMLEQPGTVAAEPITRADRLAQVESEVAAMRQEIAELRSEFAELKKQWE